MESECHDVQAEGQHNVGVFRHTVIQAWASASVNWKDETMTRIRVEVRGPTPIPAEERIRLAARLGSNPSSVLGVRERAPVTGWRAVDSTGEWQGFIVHDDARPGAGQEGEWVATSAEVLCALYTVAADAWATQGVWTHQVVLRDGDPLESTLLSLGFGHQQAYGVMNTDRRWPDAVSEARILRQQEHSHVLPLVPLVSEHQAESPVFAPRTEAFLRELDASFLDWAEADEVVVFGHFDRETREPTGFLAVDLSEAVPEIVLAAVAPSARGRGVGRALLTAMQLWAYEQRIPQWHVDWRTTNPQAHRFWIGVGVDVSAHRWSRTIDSRPS